MKHNIDNSKVAKSYNSGINTYDPEQYGELNQAMKALKIPSTGNYKEDLSKVRDMLDIRQKMVNLETSIIQANQTNAQFEMKQKEQKRRDDELELKKRQVAAKQKAEKDSQTKQIVGALIFAFVVMLGILLR